MRFVQRRLLAAVSAACFGLSLGAISNMAQPCYGARISNMQDDPVTSKRSQFGGTGSGVLSVIGVNGKLRGTCPLKHTDVKADVSGYVARVTVTQVFENTFKDKIEAVYTFPLSDSAAVDQMEMKVGNRTIHGTIKKREEARRIYDTARRQGHVASLLDQERTNIFTQSVANIEPGARVEITLHYVDLLPYEAGNYTFAFPTVVGPRFVPGSPVGHVGTGRLHDTNKVPDASLISPVVTERSGSDIAIDVHINEGGIPILGLNSKLHDIDVKTSGQNDAEVLLKAKHTIPNKDFVLTWAVAGDKLRSGYLTHKGKDEKSGYFTLMVLPPKRVAREDVAPKEMIFLVDCSGSQFGPPLQKAKDAMLYILDHMNENDTFQIISFSDTLKLSSAKPEKATADMRTRAKKFITSLDANGGTWMGPAVEKACSIPADSHRLRIVTFMTDGYVGNDYEVLGMVRKLRGNSRWFPFGTGDSVNRTLIDGIAKEGGGEPDYVLLTSSANEVGKRFYERISSPVLTDVSLDFHGMPVKEVFPHTISDVWAQRPLYICGRYTKAGEGTVTVSGFAGGHAWKQDIHLVLPDIKQDNAVLGSIWARQKVDRLMSEDWFGAQSGQQQKELKDEIISVALEHHIMTQYTSFVAVDDKTVTKGDPARTVAVPVDRPQGVSAERSGAFAAASPAPLTGKAGYGGVGGALMRGQRAAFYAAPARLQIVDEEPTVRDFRTSSGDEITSMAAPSLPPPPLPGVAAAPPPPPAHEVETWTGVNKQVESMPMAQVAAAKAPSKKAADKFESSPQANEMGFNDHSKLDARLNQLLQSKSAVPGIHLSNGCVRVKITLLSTEKKVIDELKARGVKITITEKSDVIAEVPLKLLLTLTQLSTVQRIEPAL